ncbi:MAG: HPr family phosphocarrier protein [Bdellovibrionota bacterium]
MQVVKVFKLDSSDGLHARPAGLFVKTLSAFKSAVEVEVKGQKKNGKSIMSLMSLGASSGDELKVSITGDDAEGALQALEQLFASNFAS